MKMGMGMRMNTVALPRWLDRRVAGGENPSHRGSEDQKNFDWLTACEKCLHFRAKRGLFAMLSKRNFSRTASSRLG